MHENLRTHEIYNNVRPTSADICFPRYAEITGLGVARKSEVDDDWVVVDDDGSVE